MEVESRVIELYNNSLTNVAAVSYSNFQPHECSSEPPVDYEQTLIESTELPESQLIPIGNY